MSYALRRDLAFALPFLALMAAFALAGEANPVLRAATALAALALAVAHAVTGDEFNRLRAVRAAAAAFAAALAGALVLALFGVPEFAVREAGSVWAVLIGLYAASWAVLRGAGR